MKFEFHLNQNLPKLSWAISFSKKTQIIDVYHGSNVEIEENCFFEGAWDGEFSEYLFEDSTFFVGTGCKILGNDPEQKLLVVTPNHVLEKVLVNRTDETFYASNSLAFLLAISHQELDTNYTQYESDFSSILNGINSYTSKINLCEGYCEQYFYCNLEISSTLYIEVKPKREIESFIDYSDYYKRITSMLALLGANVSSKDRNFPYGLVTTISSGYDAPACAALAKMIGCDTSVSFNKPEKYDSDSGAEIATAIGYKNIIHHSALEYLKNDNLVEAEFCASGELGTGIVFQAFEKEFSSNLVFFGERGDKIWSNSWDDFNDEFRFSNEKFAGISFTENRLRVGYFICPLPLYGAERWTSIYRISKSEEMKSYTIGGGYDRPIPRRILEEGGIARTLFGQRKIGAGINYRYDSRNRLRKRMSKDSYKSFIGYVEQNRRKLPAKLWMQFIAENRYIYSIYT